MNFGSALVGGSPGDTVGQKLGVASLRALRTFLQGLAAAFPAAGAGAEILSTGYWETFGYSVLSALIAAVVSLIQNAASILPEDPTQTTPTPPGG